MCLQQDRHILLIVQGLGMIYSLVVHGVPWHPTIWNYSWLSRREIELMVGDSASQQLIIRRAGSHSLANELQHKKLTKVLSVCVALHALF